MRMKELQKEERPREKMLELGPSGLSNGELVAILLRTGVKGSTALDQARELLSSAGNSLTGLYALSARGIRALKGLGPYKAAAVIAALELGRRFILEKQEEKKLPLITGRRVYEYMLPLLKGLEHEEFWIIFMNEGNYPVFREKLSSGGLTSTIMDIRTVMRSALELSATALIMVHNHPSGNPHPSRADIKLTDSLRKAASAFSIELIDHVVVCDDSFFSFEEGKETYK